MAAATVALKSYTIKGEIRIQYLHGKSLPDVAVSNAGKNRHKGNSLTPKVASEGDIKDIQFL